MKYHEHLRFTIFFSCSILATVILEIFSFFLRWKNLTFQLWNIPYSVGKQNVGSGMNALMSIADKRGPCTFCRKMETACTMREEMDGEVF